MAPEALDPEEFPISAEITDAKRGEAIDMWSLGATLYQLVVGKPPFLASNMFLLAEKIKTTRADIPLHLDPALRNILQKMLTVDVGKRLTLKAAQEQVYHRLLSTPPPPLRKKLRDSELEN